MECDIQVQSYVGCSMKSFMRRTEGCNSLKSRHPRDIHRNKNEMTKIFKTPFRYTVGLSRTERDGLFLMIINNEKYRCAYVS